MRLKVQNANHRMREMDALHNLPQCADNDQCEDQTEA